ncbi:restriction endonuclease [Streptomyces sp. NBC_01198]|uniref:restriction endonuclease n=1 Tax=Streptomyces sp. NBC_01198 TaxID=2903769 RepID=UPI002E1130AB|nr:restriction endonuclease [Streptomyces sp. NBC_01198]
MAQKRTRRTAARRRRNAALAGGALLLILLVAFWSAIWPYLLAALAVGGLSAGAWRLWRTDRLHRDADQRWRREDAIQGGHRTLAEVDAMSGTEFEDHVAALCRRDGCTEVRRVGGAGDNGADVLGRLPDGRTLIVQCKRYTTKSTIAARDLRDLLGSKAHFGADLAVFVTTTRFSRQSLDFAVQNGILAIHRDSLGLWNNGAALQSLLNINGAGQGNEQHRARWKNTYGKPPQSRNQPRDSK